jgi:hypothetical protein
MSSRGSFLGAKPARSKLHLVSRFQIRGTLYLYTTSGLDKGREKIKRKKERNKGRIKEEPSKYGYLNVNANCLYSVQLC